MEKWSPSLSIPQQGFFVCTSFGFPEDCNNVPFMFAVWYIIKLSIAMFIKYFKEIFINKNAYSNILGILLLFSSFHLWNAVDFESVSVRQ